MLKPKYLLPFLIIAILFVGFIVGSPFIINKIFAQAVPAGPLTGYAWSSNIGWIKFHSDASDPVSFGVQLTPEGNLIGQAWSSNIGWISFDNLGTGPDGQGHAYLIGTSIKGWARGCSVFEGGCAGTLKNDIYRGGWDGWLQMGPQTTTNGWPGVYIVDNHQLTGYAWGSEILGWVKFDGLFSGTCTGVCVGTGLSAQCTVDNPSPRVGEAVNIIATVFNGVSPYTYTWSGDVSGTSGSIDESSYSLPPISFSQPGTKNVHIAIVSGTYNKANTQSTSCDVGINVDDNTKPHLTVNVVGSGSVTSSPAGISSCKTSCEAPFNANSSVTLTAQPLTNGKFKSWSGDCASTNVDPDTGVNTCTVDMGTTNKAVTANFDEVQKFNLTISYPTGNSMVVNSRSPLPPGTQTIDGNHESSKAKVTITRFDQDVPLPDTINLSLRLDSLRSRIPQGIQSGVGMGGPILVNAGGSSQREYEIYLTFTNDAQPKPNTASPYAGNYRLTLTAAPTDGSKTLTAPVNFSYIDSREQEQ